MGLGVQVFFILRLRKFQGLELIGSSGSKITVLPLGSQRFQKRSVVNASLEAPSRIPSTLKIHSP